MTAPQIPTYDLLVSQFRGNIRFTASEWRMVADARKTPETETQLLVEPGTNHAFSPRVCLVLSGGWKKVYGGK